MSFFIRAASASTVRGDAADAGNAAARRPKPPPRLQPKTFVVSLIDVGLHYIFLNWISAALVGVGVK